MRQGVWLALVALAFLQLSIAGHQFDHSVTSVGDTCELCVQFDRLDDVVVEHAPLALLGHNDRAGGVDVSSGPVYASVIRRYASRAPPTL